MILEAMLIGGVLPGALAAAFLAALWWKHRGPRSPGTGPLWAAPLCVPLAMLPAEFLVRGGWPPLWPVAGADRLLHAGAAAGLLGVLEFFFRNRPWTGGVLRVLGAGVAVWLVIGVRVPGFWTGAQGALWIGGYAVLIAGVAAAVNHAARAQRGPAVTAVLFVSTMGAAPVLLQAGMAYPAQLSGGIAAAAGAMLLVAVMIPAFTLAGGGVTALVTVSGVLLLTGHYYAPDGIPLAQTLCLAASPLAALVTLVPAVARAPGWKQCVLAAALGAVPVAVAVVLAIAGGKGEAGGYEGGL